MNKRFSVLLTGFLAVVLFAGGAYYYTRLAQPTVVHPAILETTLIREHSPTVGPADAPVTIVEFLDPSCEACRAFYPVVKQIMAAFPNDVRLVIRYTPFHEGSDHAVKIIEAARRQDKFEPMLEATFARQPEWAIHGSPNIERLWEIAASTGLDVTKAREDAASPEIDAILQQDVADVEANGVRQTPAFFVNGKPLTSFGAQQLYDLVSSEVKAAGNPAPRP